MTDREIAKKCEWMLLELVRSEPRRVTDLVASTGLPRRVVDDAMWALLQRGEVFMDASSVFRVDACDGAYVDFQGAARACLPGGEGCGCIGCPSARGASGGW